jgi:hypothetical protein
MEDKNQSIGFLVKGKNSTISDVTTNGFTIGVQDEGGSNRFTRIRANLQNVDDSKGDRPWYEKPIGRIVLGVIIGIIVALAGYALHLSK